MHSRQIIATAVVVLIEVWLGTLSLDPWVLPVAILVGLVYLLWTWNLLPHVGPPLNLDLSKSDDDEPVVVQRIQGTTTLLAGQRSMVHAVYSATKRPINPERARYDWEPKSDVSADLLKDGLHFARRKPSDDVLIYIDWELTEYDRKVREPFQMHMLKP